MLAPIEDLKDTAQSISDSDFSRRIETQGHDELAELGRTFNEMLDRLEAAFGSQRALLRDVGHELRTPLAIVSGHLEFVGDDPEEQRETLELVRDEHQRMRGLVEDLLLLARAERPDFLELETVDLAELSDDTYERAREVAERDWRVEGSGAIRIVADRQRLEQAMMNLAENAAGRTDATDAITIGSDASDGSARLWVRDTGPPVPAVEQERLFERFRRSGDGSRYAGTGLELAIVRAVAEAHGGSVELESSPPGGARFTIRIPIDRPEEVSGA